MEKYVKIDENTKEFLLGLYQKGNTDCSLEYNETRDQILYSLAKQLATKEEEGEKKGGLLVKISEYFEEFLAELYSMEENNVQDVSFEYEEAKDQNIYSLAKLVATGRDEEEPFLP